jgi:hypothetical protein
MVTNCRIRVRAFKHRLAILRRAIACLFTGRFEMAYEVTETTVTPKPSASEEASAKEAFDRVMAAADATFAEADKMFDQVIKTDTHRVRTRRRMYL